MYSVEVLSLTYKLRNAVEDVQFIWNIIDYDKSRSKSYITIEEMQTQVNDATSKLHDFDFTCCVEL